MRYISVKTANKWIVISSLVLSIAIILVTLDLNARRGHLLELIDEIVVLNEPIELESSIDSALLLIGKIEGYLHSDVKNSGTGKSNLDNISSSHGMPEVLDNQNLSGTVTRKFSDKSPTELAIEDETPTISQETNNPNQTQTQPTSSDQSEKGLFKLTSEKSVTQNRGNASSQIVRLTLSGLKTKEVSFYSKEGVEVRPRSIDGNVLIFVLTTTQTEITLKLVDNTHKLDVSESFQKGKDYKWKVNRSVKQIGFGVQN